MRKYHEQLDKRMFDFEMFYKDMAIKMPNEAVIAEVGVAEGASAIYLAEQLLNLGKTFTFYLIDDLSYGRDMQLRILMKNVGNAHLAHLVEIVPLPSAEAACRFPDVHFDFVFIDASHKFEWTKADITLWYQKVKINGILAGHDYNDLEGAEVKQAVNMMFPKQKVVINGMRQFPLEIIHTKKDLNVWKVRKSDQLKPRSY
jgi:predicted O-methyltransferase YrrM